MIRQVEKQVGAECQVGKTGVFSLTTGSSRRNHTILCPAYDIGWHKLCSIFFFNPKKEVAVQSVSVIRQQSFSLEESSPDAGPCKMCPSQREGNVLPAHRAPYIAAG